VFDPSYLPISHGLRLPPELAGLAGTVAAPLGAPMLPGHKRRRRRRATLPTLDPLQLAPEQTLSDLTLPAPIPIRLF
jgi:hypothetical protein